MAKKVILKDVATLLNGRAYKQDELLDSGKYPVLRVGNFFSNRGWFYSDLELEDDKYCDNGDLLFAWSASFGPKIWDGGKVIFHYHIWKILTTPQIDKKYFYYFLENAADRIKESGHGIAMIHTTKSEMEQMELLLPEMEQQLQIATVLDKVSELIALRKEQLAKLDELVKARFVEMFGDLADPACSWDVIKLVDACANTDDIKCGPFGTQLSKDEYQSDGVAVWEIPQINSRFRTKPTHYLSVDKAFQLEAYSIIPGDIAMSRKGNVGKCAVFPNDFENGIIHSDVLRIRVDSIKAHPVFVMHQLHYSRSVQHQIELVSSGAIMAGINVTKLKQIQIHLPPLELQEKFASFVEQTNKTKLTIQASLDKLEVMKKALMQEYFG